MDEMKLQLFIKGSLFVEIEIFPPEVNHLIDEKAIHEIRERYMKLAVEGIKNRYAKAIENKEYEIQLVIESAASFWINMEEELELFEKTINE